MKKTDHKFILKICLFLAVVFLSPGNEKCLLYYEEIRQ
jgi:hypothetical protein